MFNPEFTATLLSILCMWLVIGWACLGYGAILARFFVPLTKPSDFVWAFWLGLGVVIAILQIWHLAWPVNGYAEAALLGGGLLLSLFCLPSFVDSVRSLAPRPKAVFLLMAIFIVLWIADRSAGAGSFYDSGLYHLAAMNWTSTYRIVPGLANLHMRLGFNSSTYLLAAMLNQGIWLGKANHLMNGFLLSALALMAVRGMVSILEKREFLSPAPWVASFAAVAVVEWGLDPQISSISADLAAVVYAISSAIIFLEARHVRNDSPRLKLALCCCLTLCAMSLSAKLSALPFSGPLGLGALWLLRPQPSFKNSALAVIQTSTLAFIIAIFWMVRQVILSGYPFYPSTAFGFPVAWKYPADKAIALQKLILYYAKWVHADAPTHFSEWWPIWLQTRVFPSYNLWKGLIPFAGGVAALVGALFFWRKLRSLDRTWLGVPWVLLCAFLGLIVWFRSGPDPRFASHLTFIILASGAALLSIGIVATVGPRGRFVFVAFALLISIGPLLTLTHAANEPYSHMMKLAMISPGPDHGLQPTPRAQNLRTVYIEPGLTLFLPPVGSNQAWDAPLPNAPYEEPDLRLRHPHRLRDGFLSRTGPGL